MEAQVNGPQGQPYRNVSAKIATLERRAEMLTSKIEGQNGSPKALNYDRSELAALESAIYALRRVRVAQGDADDPVAVLAELIEGVEGGDVAEISKAMKRGRDLLTSWTTSIDSEVLASENATR